MPTFRGRIARVQPIRKAVPTAAPDGRIPTVLSDASALRSSWAPVAYAAGLPDCRGIPLGCCVIPAAPGAHSIAPHPPLRLSAGSGADRGRKERQLTCRARWVGSRHGACETPAIPARARPPASPTPLEQSFRTLLPERSSARDSFVDAALPEVHACRAGRRQADPHAHRAVPARRVESGAASRSRPPPMLPIFGRRDSPSMDHGTGTGTGTVRAPPRVSHGAASGTEGNATQHRSRTSLDLPVAAVANRSSRAASVARSASGRGAHRLGDAGRPQAFCPLPPPRRRRVQDRCRAAGGPRFLRRALTLRGAFPRLLRLRTSRRRDRVDLFPESDLDMDRTERPRRLDRLLPPLRQSGILSPVANELTPRPPPHPHPPTIARSPRTRRPTPSSTSSGRSAP